MKKYGDDADSFHDQGTRVELSKKWHEQNQLRHDYSYRSPPKPSNRSYNRNKSSYKPDYSKTYYRPNKTNQQYQRKQSNYSSSYKSYNNQRTKKRQQYRVISVEEANRRIKKNKKSKSTSNSDDSGWIMALLCICAILAIFISFAIDMPIAFFFILLGLWGICMVIFWIVEELPKKIKSLFKKT